MMAAFQYGEDFYDSIVQTSVTSAQVIVPEVLRLLSVTSVVDLGCGEGIWLSVFARHGASRIVGIDGAHVDQTRLAIPASNFVVHDLTLPLEIQETFSLAISLEVAEHLPERHARIFVRSLTRLSRSVLFSAAIPWQTGVHHVNLQWQDYWADLFAEHGYLPIDAIRPVVWRNEEVSFWYRQNMLLFVEKAYLETQPALVAARRSTRPGQLSVVHPHFLFLLTRTVSPEQLDTLRLRQVLPRLLRMLRNAIVHRTGLGGSTLRQPDGD